MDCLIFDFLFLKYVSCFTLDAVFCGKIFFCFPEHCVTCKKILDVFINVLFIKSTGSAIVAEANLRCGFLSEKNCGYSTCRFPLFLVFNI